MQEWLSGSWPDYVIRTPPDKHDDDGGNRRTLRIARDEAGRLIGREEIVSSLQSAVWCGDGCEYVGVPGTRLEELRWRRMSTVATADRNVGWLQLAKYGGADAKHQSCQHLRRPTAC